MMLHALRPAALGAALAAIALQSAGGAATTPTVLHIASHLAKTAHASLDGGKPVNAPGYGSVVVPVRAGKHVLSVTTSTGVTYKTDLDLKPANLFNWHRKGYWCVNLLEHSVEVYSAEDCNEDVADAG